MQILGHKAFNYMHDTMVCAAPLTWMEKMGKSRLNRKDRKIQRKDGKIRLDGKDRKIQRVPYIILSGRQRNNGYYTKRINSK